MRGAQALLKGSTENASFENLELSENSPKTIKRSYAFLLLLVSLTFLKLFLVRPVPEFVPLLQFAQFLAVFILNSFLRNYSRALIPSLLIISPMLLAGSLELALLGYVLSEEICLKYKNLEPKIIKSFFRILILAFFPAALLGFYKSFDYRVVNSIFSEGGVFGVYNYLLINKSGWFESLQFMLSLLISGYFTRYFTSFLIEKRESEQSIEKGIFKGFSIGIIFAAVVLFFQISGSSIFSFNRGPFFIEEGRFQASFSDPNSFGVFAAALLPFLFYFYNKISSFYLYPVAFVLTFSSFWSGSRTYFLGLCFLCAVAIFIKYKSHLKSFSLILLLSSLLVLVLGEPSINNSIQESTNIPTFTRLLETINWSTAVSSIKSRFIFADISIYAWSLSPIFGIGIGQFYENQNGYAKEALSSENFANLNGWKDNANNFYLETLASSGIIGFSLMIFAGGILLLALRNIFKPKIRSSSFFIALSLSLLLLLQVTGPHFYFPEIRNLFFLILAFSFSLPEIYKFNSVKKLNIKNIVFYPSLLILSLLSVLLSSDIKKDSMKGFYPKEKAGGGFYEAWSTNKAEIEFCNLKDGAKLDYRLAHPDIKNSPVDIKLYKVESKNEILQDEVLVSTNNWSKLTLDKKDGAAPSSKQSYKLKVSRLFTPGKGEFGKDSRWLGARFRFSGNICKK